ncbi:hypothetical protein KY285_019537 [Solanum tuberosum]|nr:hypothetical protein KY285_019537 [Solanum tuberosum]
MGQLKDKFVRSTTRFLDDGPSPYMVHHFTTSLNPQVAPVYNAPAPTSPSLASTSAVPSVQHSLPQSTTPSPSTLSTLSSNSLPCPISISPSCLPTGPITRSQHGISKLKKPFSLLTSTSKSHLPRNPVSALRDLNWKLAMDDE